MRAMEPILEQWQWESQMVSTRRVQDEIDEDEEEDDNKDDRPRG